MSKNRYHPYGYYIRDGRIQINDAESEIIRRIFQRYALGASYKRIAEALSANGIAYMPEKPLWNKNMIARILQNVSYLGTEKYPAILERCEFEQAQQEKRTYTVTVGADLKKLRKFMVCANCGGKIQRRLGKNSKERWYCENDFAHIGTVASDNGISKGLHQIFEALLANPERLNDGFQPDTQISLDIAREEREITALLGRGDFNESVLKERIMGLAQAKYAATDSRPGETAGMITMLKERSANNKFDADLMLKIASQIQLDYSGNISVICKNGVTISERSAD